MNKALLVTRYTRWSLGWSLGQGVLKACSCYVRETYEEQNFDHDDERHNMFYAQQ